MRRTLVLGSVAVLTGSLIGCGGSSNTNGNLNVATRVVAGYVYVRQNNSPQASPAVIVSGSSVAPNGYAAPTSGTVTMTVPDGTITRAQDTENFNMASGNAVIARVTSRSSGTPTFTLAFSGLQFNGENKVENSTPSFDITGTDNTLYAINFNTASYTAGAPASMRVLVKDPSATYGGDENFRFAAPGDVIGFETGDAGLCPSSNPDDRYEVAVLLFDANGALIPGSTFSVADASPDPATEAAVTQSGSLIAVAGGGTEGAGVTLTFSSPQAPNLTASFVTEYSYGNAGIFTASFSAPSDPASIIWPDAPAPRGLPASFNSVALDFSVSNGRGIPVSGRTVVFQARDARNSGTPAVFAGNAYPSPAAGSPLSDTSTSTDGSGAGTVNFQTPNAASGDSAYNSLNIKYGTGIKIDVVIGSAILGTKVVTVNRPLNNLNIAGANRLDVGTLSRTVSPNNFFVTSATDIDTQVIAAPIGTYSWSLTPNAGGTFGDADDVTAQSISTPLISGSSTGSSIQINAGANPGTFATQATFDGVTSNVLSTTIVGPPSKIRITRAPGVAGLTGTAASQETITATFLDGFGTDVTSECTVVGKAGNITGGQLTFSPAPSRTFLVTYPNFGQTATANLSFNLNWLGTGQGTSVGSFNNQNLARVLDFTGN